jgi:inosine-uridine nucleoside N-ribohydrolase
LTNLRNLLKSQPDDVSSLDGETLVRRKVKKLVSMGGQYPEGREWNFYQDTLATKYVLKNWPAPITFCGFEVGQNILTGAALKSLPARNPVRRSYQLYNGITDRPSWDQLTVLHAVEGESETSGVSWHISSLGDNVINADGSNKWTQNPNASNNYLSLKTSSKRTIDVVNQLMLEPGAK